MAIIERRLGLPPHQEVLRDKLMEELRNPSPGAEPFVILESTATGPPVHIYVVWRAWEGLELEERSRIILEAYEEARGIEACLALVTILGLTPEEAPRFGIDYPKEPHHD